MKIRLTARGEELLRQQMATGRFRFAEEVIERALEALSERVQRRSAMSLGEFEAILDALAEGSGRLPVLPAEATTWPRSTEVALDVRRSLAAP